MPSWVTPVADQTPAELLKERHVELKPAVVEDDRCIDYDVEQSGALLGEAWLEDDGWHVSLIEQHELAAAILAVIGGESRG